ncbi:MAG: hypothetical protein Q7S14_01045 [bacterium]|nr:hypothetical protein [bacterium]
MRNKPFLKFLSGFFVNLSAGWFAVIIISPNFYGSNGLNIPQLTIDFFWFILCTVSCIKIEERLEYVK